MLAPRNLKHPIISKIEVVVELVPLRQRENASERQFLAFIEPKWNIRRLTKGNLPISPIAPREESV
jgi:hypothetical protein